MKHNCGQQLVKLIFSFSLFAIMATSSFAQQKAMLTKEETINYIKKKITDCLKLRDKDKYYLEYSSLKISDCDVKVYYSYVTELGGLPTNESRFSYKEYNYEASFNPMQILEISINDATSSADVGAISIKMKAKTAKKSIVTGKYVEKKNPYYQGSPYQDRNGKWWDATYQKYEKNEGALIATDFITIPYLKSDPDNFNKLKKAFEHLRDLCKAEDDPFGQ
jgi:hypothetical protein